MNEVHVIGVDVGLQVCGYAMCAVRNTDVVLIREGELKPSAFKLLPQKLSHIFEGLRSIITEFNPDAIVVEQLYSHHKHPVTLGILAQVRGVVALLAHQSNLKFIEYSPTRARKSFLGRGNVNSVQVKKMAENVTGHKFQSNHTADAFSLVVAFSHAQKLKNITIAYENDLSH